ncbi:MAG TPA: CBS domain-containing protein, partial [Candidatus Limnocylindrales bacterium]
MSELTETAIAARVPSLLDARITVLPRRDPVAVRPGTSLARCLAAIQHSGVGDSVLVTEEDGRLAGVLTERDIFARLVGSDVDASRPVDEFMTTSPNRLRLEQTV